MSCHPRSPEARIIESLVIILALALLRMCAG